MRTSECNQLYGILLFYRSGISLEGSGDEDIDDDGGLLLIYLSI